MMHNPPQIYGAPLFAAVPDSENLLTAWEKIDENAAGLGLNGVSLKVFGAALEEELTRLSHALHSKAKKLTYRSPVTWGMWSFLLMIRFDKELSAISYQQSALIEAISGQQKSYQRSAQEKGKWLEDN